MSGVLKRVNVGVDVSKRKIDVCLFNTNPSKSNYYSVPNSLSGFNALIDFLSTDYPLCEPYFVYESTGSYSTLLKKYLTDNGFNHKMMNAKVIKSYSRVIDLKGKTDKKDSYILAHYCSTLEENNFNTEFNETKETIAKHLKAMELLQKELKQLNNHKKQIPLISEDDKSLKGILEEIELFIKKKQEKIEKKAKSLTEATYKVYSRVKEVKGLGDKTIVSILPKIYDMVGIYSKREIVSFFGFNPIQFQSGSSINYKDRLSHSGDRLVKKNLYMASMVALQFNPIIKKYYDKQIDRGKNGKIIVMNIAKKLIHAIYSIIYRYKIEKGLLQQEIYNKS